MQLRGVRAVYGRGRVVLDGVDLDLGPGQVVAVTGANGAGKTTLLRVVSGARAASAGRVRGRPRPVAYAPERFPPSLRLTPAAYLAHISRVRGLPATRGEALLERFGLDDRDRPLAELSKGTNQKVALAQALLAEPSLLVLDEPWSGLDTPARAELSRRLRGAADAGTTIVVSDHTGHATAIADHLLQIGDGTVRQAPAPPARQAPQLSLWLEGAPDRAALDHLLPAQVPMPETPVARRRGWASRLLGLVRYQLALVLSGQRWVAPVLAFLAFLLAVYAADPGPAAGAYGSTAAALYPVAAWLSVVVGNAEPDAQRDVVVVAAGGTAPVVAGRLAAGAALVAVLGAVAVAAPAALGAFARVTPADLTGGLAAHALCGLAGLVLGAFVARPLVQRPGAALAALLTLLLATVILAVDRAPDALGLLVPPVMPLLRAMATPAGPPEHALLALTAHTLTWSAAALALLLAATRYASRRR